MPDGMILLSATDEGWPSGTSKRLPLGCLSSSGYHRYRQYLVLGTRYSILLNATGHFAKTSANMPRQLGVNDVLMINQPCY